MTTPNQLETFTEHDRALRLTKTRRHDGTTNYRLKIIVVPSCLRAVVLRAAEAVRPN